MLEKIAKPDFGTAAFLAERVEGGSTLEERVVSRELTIISCLAPVTGPENDIEEQIKRDGRSLFNYVVALEEGTVKAIKMYWPRPGQYSKGDETVEFMRTAYFGGDLIVQVSCEKFGPNLPEIACFSLFDPTILDHETKESFVRGDSREWFAQFALNNSTQQGNFTVFYQSSENDGDLIPETLTLGLRRMHIYSFGDDFAKVGDFPLVHCLQQVPVVQGSYSHEGVTVRLVEDETEYRVELSGQCRERGMVFPKTIGMQDWRKIESALASGTEQLSEPGKYLQAGNPPLLPLRVFSMLPQSAKE